MKKKFFTVLLSVLLLGMLLTACSGASGTNSWAGVTASGSAVYFNNGTTVLALRSDNGNVIWTYPEKAATTRLFFAAPVVVGEQLLVEDYSGLLVSLSTRDGKQLWQFAGAKGRYIDSPLVVNDTIIAQNADGSIYALDLKGTLLWSFKAKHAFWATPVSDGKVVYAPSLDHYLYAIDLTNGSLLWKVDLGGPLLGRPLLTADGTIYLGTMDNSLVALKSADGSIVWQQKLSGGVWAAPVIMGDRIYVGDQTGNIYLMKVADGSLIQTMGIGSAILGNGVVMNNSLVFGDEKGEVIVIGSNGERLWTRSLTGKIYSNLVFSDNQLYVLTTKGDKPLSAYDVNGNELWYYTASK